MENNIIECENSNAPKNKNTIVGQGLAPAVKKALSLLLAMIMLFSITASIDLSAYAASNPYPTQQDEDLDGHYEIPCTYYAWKMVYNNLGITLPGWGNGGQWLDNAKKAGYSTGTTAKANSIAVWQNGGCGHVAFVKSVSGSTMVIAEGGRTDLDTTSSHGVDNNFSTTTSIGSIRPTNNKLVGFIYLQNAISAPTNLNVDTINEKVNISWNASVGATSYVVYIYSKSNCSEYVYKNQVTSTSINNISINPGRYWIYVHAVNASGASSGCGPFNYLGCATNVSAYQTDDKIRVKWTGVNGANCYDVIVTDPNGTTNWYHSGETEKYIPVTKSGIYKINVQSLYRPNGSTTGQIVGAHSKEVECNILSHNHSWITTMTKAATCTAAGTKTYTCTKCKATKKETIKATGHSYKTTVTKATTKKNGGSVTKCTKCGNVSKKTTIYYPKTVTLSTTAYTYDGKVKKPGVTVKNSAGKTIAASNYTVTYPSGRKNVGTYTVKITFKGNYSGSVSKTFKINPKNTSISGLTAQSKAFTVKLKKYTTQTTGYQIQYSTSSNFKNAKTVTVKNSTTSKKISKLSGKKKYYVRVRTYKTVGKTNYYSSWSKAKTVTTKK